MSKRLWIFLLLCCSVTFALLFVQHRRHSSDRQPSEIITENSTEVPQPGLTSTELGTTGASDETQSPARVSADASEQPRYTERIHRVVKREPEALPNHNAEKPAEVLSYPPILQQNASNNFVRAMQTLANAKTETERYLALANAAKSDFIFGQTEEARNYASELLSLDEKFKGEPWRDGGAVYEANSVLGRLAAQEGRMDEAKQYLLESGKSTGSPVLGSFGPNMNLARDLLQSGERDSVLEFFDLCRKFWTSGGEKLTLWAEDVSAGRMPDFGPNLFY